jgi:hypothetical protein
METINLKVLAIVLKELEQEDNQFYYHKKQGD